jgi:hypothetical protein
MYFGFFFFPSLGSSLAGVYSAMVMQCHGRDGMTLQHILPNIPDNGTINSWLPLVQNREQWKTLGTEWIKHRQALTIYQYGPHPLLGDGILDHQFFWYLQDIHCQFSMNDGHV